MGKSLDNETDEGVFMNRPPRDSGLADDLGLGTSPVSKICSYTHCPKDGRDHRTRSCIETCPYEFHAYKTSIKDSE